MKSRVVIRVLRLSCIAIVAAAVSCNGRDRQGAQAAEQPVPAEVTDRGTTFSQDSLRDWFIDTGMSNIPGTEDELIGTLGQPDSAVRLPSASRADPVAFDTIIEVHYPGLAVTILKVGANETLQSIRVADSTYLTGPIRLGTDTSTLRRLLGPPMLSGAMPGYVCGLCSVPNESVRFELVEGKVAAMLFTFPGE
jgi:hypothetical protein